MSLERRSTAELEAEKAALEYQAQMCALEGLPMSPADQERYRALREELTRRKNGPGHADRSGKGA